MPPEIPEWVEGLKWIIAAGLLAFAIVGPKIFGPFIDRFKASLPPVQPNHQTTIDRNMVVVGGALADRESIMMLVQAIDRLSDSLEDVLADRKKDSEEQRARRMIADLMKEMFNQEQGRKT